jgi:putative protease
VPKAPAPARVAEAAPDRLGVVTHFYGHANAAILRIETGELRRGDTIHFRGHTTDFYQRIERIELEHQVVESARSGQTVGVQVSQRVREGDEVNKVAR